MEQTNTTLMRNDVVVRLTDVTKTFGNFVAIKDLNLEIRKGERIGLIGANGAGKTTISEIIVGLSKPTTGRVEYGFKYDKMPQEKIGMQFQDSVYPSGLTVKNIITFAKRIHHLTISDEEILKLLKVFQMDDFYNRTSRSLSGGQRQKLNILLSILHNPELVILDEISTGLDLSAREEIIHFTDKVLKSNNITAILVSHHMEEIETLCDKVVVLQKGRIIEIATIPQINEKYGSLSKLMRKIIQEGNAIKDVTKTNDLSVHKLLRNKKKTKSNKFSFFKKDTKNTATKKADNKKRGVK